MTASRPPRGINAYEQLCIGFKNTLAVQSETPPVLLRQDFADQCEVERLGRNLGGFLCRDQGDRIAVEAKPIWHEHDPRIVGVRLQASRIG